MQRRETLWGLFFISPWVIGFLAFTLFPIIASLWFSFTNYNIVNPAGAKFIGLYNWDFMFTKDNVFRQALGNTLYYGLGLVIIGTITDIFLAMLLNTKIRGRATYRLIYFIPVLIPAVAGALIWVWILNTKFIKKF